MTFHLCVYTMQSLFSSLLYPLPPPLFATPILFFFTIILPPSLYPSFLSSPLLLPTFPLSPLLPLPSPQAGANMIVSGTPVSEDVGQWSRLPASACHKQVSLCEAE